MVIEEGMDDAARLIQQKYRKKKQNNKKIESIEKPKSFDELPKAKGIYITNCQNTLKINFIY